MTSPRPFGVLAAFISILLPTAANAQEAVDFVREVRPIMEAKCARCHGMKRQRSGLRLDRKADAFAGGDEYGPAIVAGKSADSPLYKMIAGKSDRKMPPDGPGLTAAEIDVIRRWIDQGARWPEDPASTAPTQTVKKPHWSFQPVVRPALPSVANEKWIRNPIDRFVLKALEKAGLEPSPEADRAALIRRLSFDLIGLPPSPEEVDAFVRDPDPMAYEKLVDRLLASPHHGERWARHWLDVVRFAESHGFEMNQARRNAWVYRDYVIRSINEDKPYNQFIREQLAGDALGVDEATGFLVAGPWDQVKSPDPVLTAQQRADELHDMIGTTGSAFLGLTVGCARCHDHKFDPIPQVDYYRLKACLEGVQHGDRPIGAPSAGESKKFADRRREIDSLRARLDSFEPKATLGRRVRLEPRDGERLLPAQGPTMPPAGKSRGEANDTGGTDRLPYLGTGYLHWNVADKNVMAWRPRVEGRFRVWVSWGSGWPTHTTDARYLIDRDGKLETAGDQSEILRVDQRHFAEGTGNIPSKSLWSGFRDAGVHEFQSGSRLVLRGGSKGVVTSDLIILEEVGPEPASVAKQPSLRLPPSPGRNVDRFEPIVAKHLRMTITGSLSAQPCIDELEVFTAEPKPKNVAVASAGGKATASGTLPGHAIHKLAHVNDGKYGNDHSWISDEAGKGWVAIEFDRPYSIDRVSWSRDRTLPPKYLDRVVTEYRIETSLDGQTWTPVASGDDRLPIRDPAIKIPGGYLPNWNDSSPERDSLLAELRAKEAALPQSAASPMAYAGRFTQPGPTRRLHRGDATMPKEPIDPGTLTEFGASLDMAKDTPEQKRRLALADWIADPKNPLTSRVMVNRLWQYHFGAGIVSTPSDLGINGGRPSHPELLDWLASEFVQPSPGSTSPPWNLKAIHRLICLSATYRQSSRPREKALAVDAGNVLLWRYPSRRLEAEPLRDAILTVTGKINFKAGGPGFDLFEPNSNYVKVYTPRKSFGTEEFRRMVYQAKPRMQLDDTFGVFDCPDAGQVAPRRTSSTTPLQAFNLLNSPFMIEQAEFFAERLRGDAGDSPADQVRLAFRLAFGRVPVDSEQTAAQTLIREHGLPAFCRAMLSANEFLYVP